MVAKRTSRYRGPVGPEDRTGVDESYKKNYPKQLKAEMGKIFFSSNHSGFLIQSSILRAMLHALRVLPSIRSRKKTHPIHPNIIFIQSSYTFEFRLLPTPYSLLLTDVLRHAICALRLPARLLHSCLEILDAFPWH